MAYNALYRRFRPEKFGEIIGQPHITKILLNQQKKSGVAVLYVGEDLDVLLELCDRILVLCGGKVSGIVDGRSAEKRQIGRMMTSLGGNT